MSFKPDFLENLAEVRKKLVEIRQESVSADAANKLVLRDFIVKLMLEQQEELEGKPIPIEYVRAKAIRQVEKLSIEKQYNLLRALQVADLDLS